MDRIGVFLAAAIPALLLLAYGVTKGRSSWSSEALSSAFLLGAVGALGALVVELGLQALIPLEAFSPLANAGLKALALAAIPEETVKFIILFGAAIQHVDTRRFQDIVPLALAVSLGFATLENILYVATPPDWQWIAAARAVTAVPGHAIYGLTMGALLTLAMLRPARQQGVLILSLVTPVILHAAYDFPLFAVQKDQTPWLLLVWLFVLVASLALAVILCNRALSMAAIADRDAGRDRESAESANCMVVGCIMVIGGPVAGFLAFHFKGLPLALAGAALGFVPIALGLDLIWTGIRRSKGKFDPRAGIPS